MEQTQASPRYRVNISRTSTGKYSFDCTVERTAAQSWRSPPLSEADARTLGLSDRDLMALVLAESDRLVKALEAKYPVQEAI